MNLSAAYNEMGDFKKALASSKEGIVELTPIAMKDKDPEMVRILLIAYFNCGLYESELKNLESARRWFEKGKNIAKDFLPKMKSIQDVYRQIRLKISDLTETSLKGRILPFSEKNPNKSVNCNYTQLSEDDLIQPFYTLRPKVFSKAKGMRAPQHTAKASSEAYGLGNESTNTNVANQNNNIFDKKPRPSSAYGNFNPNLGLGSQNQNNSNLMTTKDCTGSGISYSGHLGFAKSKKKRPNSAINAGLAMKSASSSQAHKIGPHHNHLDSIYAAEEGVGPRFSLRDRDHTNPFSHQKRPQNL